MIWTSISDIHIKPHDQKSQEILLTFLDKSYEMNAEKIFLLGDIFDLMVGSHDEYLDQYPEIFGKIAEGIKKNINIYFFEGNHDFHLKELWNTFSVRFNVSPVHYIKDHLVLDYQGKRVLLSHGDNSSKEDGDYRLYKSFIRSGFIKVLSTNIVPHEIVDGIGVWASGKSRKYSGNEKLFEKIKKKYRKIAEYEAEKHRADIVIAGHSHTEDIYEFGEKTYLNNGMSLRTKKFIILDSEGSRLEELML